MINYLLTISKVSDEEKLIEKLASLLASITKTETTLAFEGEGRNRHVHILFSSSSRKFDLQTTEAETELLEKYLEKENGPIKLVPRITNQ